MDEDKKEKKMGFVSLIVDGVAKANHRIKSNLGLNLFNSTEKLQDNELYS